MNARTLADGEWARICGVTPWLDRLNLLDGICDARLKWTQTDPEVNKPFFEAVRGRDRYGRS